MKIPRIFVVLLICIKLGCVVNAHTATLVMKTAIVNTGNLIFAMCKLDESLSGYQSPYWVHNNKRIPHYCPGYCPAFITRVGKRQTRLRVKPKHKHDFGVYDCVIDHVRKVTTLRLILRNKKELEKLTAAKAPKRHNRVHFQRKIASKDPKLKPEQPKGAVRVTTGKICFDDKLIWKNSKSGKEPLCSSNGAYFSIQCAQFGKTDKCWCVDSVGKKTSQEEENVYNLPCHRRDMSYGDAGKTLGFIAALLLTMDFLIGFIFKFGILHHIYFGD